MLPHNVTTPIMLLLIGKVLPNNNKVLHSNYIAKLMEIPYYIIMVVNQYGLLIHGNNNQKPHTPLVYNLMVI